MNVTVAVKERHVIMTWKNAATLLAEDAYSPKKRACML